MIQHERAVNFDFHTGADMINSDGSDFFAGGALGVASSAMVSTSGRYALRRRRRAVAMSCEAARARILGLGSMGHHSSASWVRGHHSSATRRDRLQ
jgi:hypothetical protein